MNKLLVFSCLLLLSSSLSAQRFEDYFEDRTLRIDYTFAGDNSQSGNGQIIMRSHQKEEVIYRHSFSTLFQEWMSTEEAKHTKKSFENIFLVPFPKDTIDITVELYDYHDKTAVSMTHTVIPTDILIRKAGERDVTPYDVLQQAKDSSNCIHIAFVAEGYTADEMEHYLNDCQQAISALFRHEPFKSLQDRFNMIALKSVSEESGTSEPSKGIWKHTALASHFDTFYSDRYLTTLHLKQLHNLLAKYFLPVVVHEFGHSFGGLGDEYAYGNDDPMYFADTEPWEPNLTTQHRFIGKWEDLVKEGQAGLFEGGGYLTNGVWRGCENCRMRTNEEPDFCIVCRRALTRLIDFYTQPTTDK